MCVYKKIKKIAMATMTSWHDDDKCGNEEQPYEREYAADPPRKRMRLPIRLATGEVLYRAADGSFTSNPTEEHGAESSIVISGANEEHTGDEKPRSGPNNHVYSSKEEYFVSEDTVRAQMAFLCTKVMASPDSRPIVAELVSFLADYEALSNKFSNRLTDEMDISLDILLKDVGGHGPLAGLSRERQRKLQERQKQLVRLCLQGNGNAKDKIVSAIELDKVGYTANNLVISLGKYLEKARYSIKHMFVFDVFLGLRIADGVSDLDPNAGRGVKFFLKRLDSELKTVKSNKKMTKKQRSLAIELKEYKNELKREGIRQTQNDMVAVHSSTLTELFAIFTTILRKQFNHCVYALEKVFLGCERYHRFLSVMYVKDLSAVIRNMLLSSIFSMPETILDQRMHVLDSLTSQAMRDLTSGILHDDGVSATSSLKLKTLLKTKGSHEANVNTAESVKNPKNLKDSEARTTYMQPMFSQKVKQAFGLSKEFSRLESLFTQKLLEKDIYATRGFVLPIRAGLTGCLVVGKIQSELKGLSDVIELDLIIPLFYLLIHSVDITTAEMTKLYVRGLFYCIQPSIGTKERIEVVKKYLHLMKHVTLERESWTIIESYYQSLVKRYGNDEDSDDF